jgi:hypothetical protein
MAGDLTRRAFLASAGAASALLLLPRAGFARARLALGDAARQALATSPLVYVSPLRKDGSESRCHAEVWFVADGDGALVVTGSDRWRAVAITQGHTRARLWVGDFGVWTDADGGWKRAPSFDADASLVTDPVEHARALALFGAKYSAQWDSWGPKFRKGLADGSRVLIRYAARS